MSPLEESLERLQETSTKFCAQSEELHQEQYDILWNNAIYQEKIVETFSQGTQEYLPNNMEIISSEQVEKHANFQEPVLKEYKVEFLILDNLKELGLEDHQEDIQGMNQVKI